MLRHVKYTIDDSMTPFDGFVHEVDSSTVVVKTMLSVCPGSKNAFFIQMEEFQKSDVAQGMTSLNTFNDKIFVVWKWNFLPPDVVSTVDSASDPPPTETDHQTKPTVKVLCERV